MNAKSNSAPPVSPGYFIRLWSAVCGRAVDLAPLSPVEPATDPTFAARLAGLEMDLRERDERIALMREEYALLERERDAVGAAAGEEQLTRLFRKLSAPLATLSTVSHAAREGQPVEVRDLADLVAGVEKALAGFGLEAIGQAGAELEFDTALHQRMSGGTPNGGDRVRVRLPGYRHGMVVLQKAMVSGREDAEGTGDGPAYTH